MKPDGRFVCVLLAVVCFALSGLKVGSASTPPNPRVDFFSFGFMFFAASFLF